MIIIYRGRTYRCEVKFSVILITDLRLSWLIMGQIDANDNDLISQFYGAIKMNWLKDLS